MYEGSTRKFVVVICTLFLVAATIQDVGAQTSSSPAIVYGPDTPSGTHAATVVAIPGPDPDGWLFPISKANEYLPAWIQFGGQFRNRVESQDGLRFAPVNDVYDLTQVRLGVTIQPTSWFKLVGVTQDARVFFNQHVPDKPPYQNIWDVREAYAELGSSSEGWFDLIGGREILSFGDERVIGPSEWANMGRTFDAVRLDVHHTGFKVSIFAASVILATDGVVDHHLQGNNLYGVYGSLTNMIPHATLEPYLLWRVAPGTVRLSENAGLGHLDEVTGGARIAGTIRTNLDYDLEMNKQTGSLGPKSIEAWAGHWNAGYTFKNTRGEPRPFAEYNYASGNKNPNGNTWGTHDQIYPSAHNKMDLADQFGWRNVEDLRSGADEKLGRKWELTEILNNVWLATKNDAVYNNAGAISVPANPKASSRYAGTEVDVVADIKQNRHITYGFGFAHLFAGQFLKETVRGKDYNYPFAWASYVF